MHVRRRCVLGIGRRQVTDGAASPAAKCATEPCTLMALNTTWDVYGASIVLSAAAAGRARSRVATSA